MRVGWILWGVALVAAATGAWRADADLESRVHVVWFGLIGAGVWAAHELSTSRLPARTAQPSRRTVSPANRSMLVLSSASVLAAGVVLAVSAVTAVGDGPPVAAVAVSQLVAVAVSRAGRAESGPGVHEAVFAGLLLLFGSPLALAVSAAIVASVVGVLLPAVAGLVAWWVDQRRNPPTSARVGEVPSRSGSGAQEG